ncbi:MAG TPA: hypothetical protein VFX73_12755, partial [Chitinophagaceae bacterium]|nr:hypothetical protein [Chitinophagaceae bacterium]
KLAILLYITIWLPLMPEAQQVTELELMPQPPVMEPAVQPVYKQEKPHPVSMVGGAIGMIGFFALLFTGVIVYEDEQFAIGWDNIDFDTAEISGAGMLLASIPIVLAGESMDKKRKSKRTTATKNRNSLTVCTKTYTTPTGFSTHSIRVPSIGISIPLSK